jgi:hypothetical protein
MASLLEPVAFDPAVFRKELDEFDALLKSKADLPRPVRPTSRPGSISGQARSRSATTTLTLRCGAFG